MPYLSYPPFIPAVFSRYVSITTEVTFSTKKVTIIGVRCGTSATVNGHYDTTLQRVIFGRFQCKGLNLKFVHFR